MTRWIALVETAPAGRWWPWDKKSEVRLSPPVAVPVSAAVGDKVVLWRGQFGGGVVAIGSIIDELPVESRRGALRRILEGNQGAGEHVYRRCALRYDFYGLSTPLTTAYLRSSGLQMLIAQVPGGGEIDGEESGAVELDMDDSLWARLTELAEGAPEPTEWPTAWHINPGEIVRSRRELHAVYGGNTRARIAPSGKTPNVMMFVDPDSAPIREASAQISREAGTIHVLGNAEYDSRLTGENLIALGHVNRGLALRVFELQHQGYRYLGEFTAAQKDPVQRWVVSQRDSRYAGTLNATTPVLRLQPIAGRALSGAEDSKSAPTIRLSLKHTVTVARTENEPKPDDGGPGIDDETAMIHRLHAFLKRDTDAVSAVSALGDAQSMAALIQLARRQRDLAELRSIIDSPDSLEADLQKLVQGMPWLFGGEFLSRSARRNLTTRDQLDMSLIRPDGSIHGVELKKANIENLIRRRGSYFVVGAQVNYAVGQAFNYLASLDEQRDRILSDFNIDCRRASITVVVGHSSFVSADCDRKQILETIRTYNSHLTRVSVVMYDSLIDNAERALALGQDCQYG